MPALGLKEKLERVKRGEAVGRDGKIYKIPFKAKQTLYKYLMEVIPQELIDLDEGFEKKFDSTNINPPTPDAKEILKYDPDNFQKLQKISNENFDKSNSKTNSLMTDVTKDVDKKINRRIVPAPSNNSREVLTASEKKNFSDPLGFLKGIAGKREMPKPATADLFNSPLGQDPGNSKKFADPLTGLKSGLDTKATNGRLTDQQIDNILSDQAMQNYMAGSKDLAKGSGSEKLSSDDLLKDLDQLQKDGPEVLKSIGSLKSGDPMAMASILADEKKCEQFIRVIETILSLPNTIALMMKKIWERIRKQYDEIVNSLLNKDVDFWTDVIGAEFMMIMGELFGTCIWGAMKIMWKVILKTAGMIADSTVLYAESIDEMAQKFGDNFMALFDNAQLAAMPLSSFGWSQQINARITKILQMARQLCRFMARTKQLIDEYLDIIQKELKEMMNAMAGTCMDALDNMVNQDIIVSGITNFFTSNVLELHDNISSAANGPPEQKLRPQTVGDPVKPSQSTTQITSPIMAQPRLI